MMAKELTVFVVMKADGHLAATRDPVFGGTVDVYIKPEDALIGKLAHPGSKVVRATLTLA